MHDAGIEEPLGEIESDEDDEDAEAVYEGALAAWTDGNEATVVEEAGRLRKALLTGEP